MRDRARQSRAFLAGAGWDEADRRFLAGDASNRSYDRLRRRDGTTAVLMDAPPELGEDVAAFARIARHLRALGLAAPAIFDADTAHGFLLLEDLGDDLFARLLEQDPTREAELYTAATDVLIHLQTHSPAAGLSRYDGPAMAAAVAPAIDDYATALTGTRASAAPLCAAMAEALAHHAARCEVMILRDYHAENLLWLPGRSGLARVGLLDFQLALIGHPAYDLVSLLQDARRDVPPAIESAMMRHFAEATGTALAEFCTAYAVIGAQRNLRILGIFARLATQAEKPGYLRLMPRVWALARRDLAHPALADVARIVEKTLPPPTETAIRSLHNRCRNPAPTP